MKVWCAERGAAKIAGASIKDRRGIYCVLTEKGRAARVAAGPYMLHAIHHVFGQHFSVKETESFFQMMQRIQSAANEPIPLP